MGNSEEIRWRQRLENFEKAVLQLDGACTLDAYSDLERAGLIRMFQFSYELAWKTLKDLLYFEGIAANTPREVIRHGFEAGYLNEADTETLLDALDKRNLLVQTYREEAAHEAELLIKSRYAPVLRRLHDTLQARKRA